MKLLALAIAGLAAGCLSSEQRVGELQLRAAVLQLDVRSIEPQRLGAIERGEVWIGASEIETFLARGAPRLWWNTPAGGRDCRVLVEASLRDPRSADTAVTVCNGAVVALAPISPALPAWRIADVGPRVVQHAAYFDDLPYRRQWEIVAGILERGQSESDVEIAFGEPYRRGFEEREDGNRADKLVFLDHSGNAYGLNITLVDNRVVGWSMPAEEVLTSEAQQRRLDAMEHRLQARIGELEELTKKQHAETVAQFRDVMEKRESMMTALASPFASAAGVALRDLTAPREVEVTHEGTEDDSSSGSIQVHEDGAARSVQFNEHETKSSTSKTVTKRR